MSETIRYAAVSLIEREDGRILCVWNRRAGGWSLPGGLVEQDETPEVGQQRELQEETGLTTLSARRVYEGDTAAPPERGRASRVILFQVNTLGVPREVEKDCPVEWKTRQEFLAESPFAAFYERAFEAVPPDPLVIEREEHGKTQLALAEAEAMRDALGQKAHQLQQKLDEALALANEAIDHLECVLSSDSDMPSHDATEAAATAFIDEARTRLGALA